MKERVLYFDVAKAFAIFCVILGDVFCVYDPRGVFSPVSTFVHTFHTALFMFISGVFFKKALSKDFWAVIKGKSRQLLIPYLTWSIVLLFLVFIPSKGFDNIEITITDFVKGGFLRNYWYLKALFVYIIVTYFFIRIAKSDVIGLIASFLFFTIAPSVFNTALFIPYFVTGYLYGKYNPSIRRKGCVLALVIIVSVLYFLWKPEYNYNISESMAFKPYMIRTLIGIIDSVLILSALEVLCKKEGLAKKISIVGKYTLGIYCCNDIFFKGFSESILSRFASHYNTIACLCISIATFVLSYYLCRLIDKNKYSSLLLLGNKLS